MNDSNLAWFVLACVILISPLELSADTPNVIVVLTDDQGYGDFSVNGNPVIKTPKIDDLANQGFRFTDFHVASMCTPTRAQLMSGMDAMRNGAINVSSGRSLLDPSLKTMANVFHDAGYATGIFGKWHLGDNYPFRPEDRGFDEAIWFPSSHINSVADVWDNDYFDDIYMHNGKRERFTGYCTDVFFDQSIDWMKKRKEASQPFFAFLPTNAAHWPPFVPDKYRVAARKALEAKPEVLQRMLDAKMGRYYGDDNKEALVSFLAMGLNIDENVGKLTAFLQDSGLAENTIVIFMTDNGSSFGRHYYNAGMKGGKMTLWEGGHRVPLFVVGPKTMIGEARSIDDLCHVQDLLPTLAAIIGAENGLPENLDGVNLLPLMKREVDRLDDRMLVVNFCTPGNAVSFHDEVKPKNRAYPLKENGAVLWKKWRFLNNKALYNVEKDPFQKKNVARENPKIVRAMRQHLNQWWDGVKANSETIHRIVIGSQQQNPIMLTACDWYDIFVDMQKQIRQGVKKNGYWHVIVDRPGTYEFELRRWPVESDFGLNDAIPTTKVTDGVLPAGAAFRIASADLIVGGQKQSAKVSQTDKSVRFTCELDAGEVSILTCFRDTAGQRIAGAYYLYVNRLGGKRPSSQRKIKSNQQSNQESKPKQTPTFQTAKIRTNQKRITLLDFEDQALLQGNNASHKSKVTQVEGSAVGNGKFVAKTVVDSEAGAAKFFGTGFRFAKQNLTGANEISMWIKTDIDSGFNLQLHSGNDGNGSVSIYSFQTSDSVGKWKKISAPLKRFRKPPWAKNKADLAKISKIQVTAFGNGPYDGKYILLDDISVSGMFDASKSTDASAEDHRKVRLRKLKEPIILRRGDPISMFDGKTLNGWTAIPRVYVPKEKKFETIPSDKLFDAVIAHYEQSDGQTNRVPDRERVKNNGVWKMEEGAVIGGQSPGSIAGSYLMSEKTFGDFELTMETNPDYPIDTGIMIRAHRLGSIGYQVLVDNRPNGTIGGVYGNSVGNFFAYPFVFDADEEPLNRVANFRPGNPNAMKFRGGQFRTDFAASLEAFLNVWKPNDWNKIKIRCTGRVPLIETWINGVPIAKINTSTLADQVPGYDAEAIFKRIGRRGHIGFEVHDSPIRDRWAPGAKCRWRSVRIRELVCEEANDAESGGAK